MATPEIDKRRAEVIAQAKLDESWQGAPYLGKFDDELGEAVWMLSMDSSQDAETGETDAYGWYALFADLAVVLECQSSGAVYACVYGSRAEATEAFETADREYSVWLGDDDGDDDDDAPITDDATLSRGTFVTVHGRNGIAWHVLGITGNRVRVQMIGDDRPETVDRDDVTVIDRDAFCGECGQMGCRHDGLDRGDA